MKIKMLDTVAYYNGVYKQHFTYDLPEHTAKKFIDRNLAESAEEPRGRIPAKRKTTSLQHGNKG